MGEVDKRVNEIDKKIESSENKLNDFNMQSITILGIFSGIVMAFFGGMSFINEVLKNMHTVSKYRMTFIVLTIGLILFNLFFFFMYFIGKLVDKPLRNECIFNNCGECHNKCKLHKKLKRTYPILYYANSFFWQHYY